MDPTGSSAGEIFIIIFIIITLMMAMMFMMIAVIFIILATMFMIMTMMSMIMTATSIMLTIVSMLIKLCVMLWRTLQVSKHQLNYFFPGRSKTQMAFIDGRDKIKFFSTDW